MEKNSSLEANLKYRHKIYGEIDDLILEQKCCLNEDGDITDVERFLDIQTQINDLFLITQKSKKDAMLKICTNELLYANQSKDGRKSSEMKDFVMITINPMTTVTVDQLVNAVKRFMGSAFVEYGMYVFEQRSPDSNWYGWHCHLLFKRGRKPAMVREGIQRILRPLTGNDQAIKVKSQSELLDVKNYVNYMKGVKKDPNKALAIEQTVLWRESLGLSSVYTVGDCSLLVEQSPGASGKIVLKKNILKK